MDDIELLGRYAHEQDQQAFGTLVSRHEGWVYAAARRQVRDEHAAQDVAQAVFVMLARRAGKLKGYGYLGGWLFRALSYCTEHVQRERVRRKRQEAEAARMRSEVTNMEADWEQVAPELEAAVGRLGKADRDAVILRFYEQRPLVEVGRALGISEEAAKKRVQRAVGKLREKLAGKGVEVEAGSLGTMVLAHAVEGGMEGGAAGLVEKVMAGIGGGAGNGTAGLIAKGAMKMMVMVKVKVAAVVIGVALGGVISVGLLAQATAVKSNEAGIQVIVPDGRPAAGAAMYPITPQGPYLDDPLAAGLSERGPTSRPETGVRKVDAQGYCPINGFSSDTTGVVFVHADGFKVVELADLDKTRQVKLDAWGRIEGTIGPNLRLPNGKVQLIAQQEPPRRGMSYSLSVAVQADGTFVFDHVPPGRVLIAREIPWEPRWARSFSDHHTLVNVSAGGTVPAMIGGSGVQVHVRAIVPEAEELSLAKLGMYAELVPRGKPIPEVLRLRAEISGKAPEEKKAIVERWMAGPDGKTLQAWDDRQRSYYVAFADAEGVLVFKDILASDYVLSITAKEVGAEPKVVVRGMKEVTVAADTQDIDLGDVKLASYTVQNEVTGNVNKAGETGGQVQQVPDEPTRTSLATIRALLDGIRLYALEHKLRFPDKLDDLAKYLGPALPRLLINPDRPNQHPGYIYLKPTGQFDKIDPGLVLLYEGFDAWPTGGVGVGFADGHCEKIRDEATFRRLLEASEAKP